MAGNLRDALGHLRGNAGRGDFLYLTVVFRVVVKELVAGDHLRNGQQNGLLTGFVTTLGNLGAIKETLDHDLRALHHRLADGGSQLVSILHLGDAKRRAVGSGLHEARHTYLTLNLIVADQLLIAFADE